MKRLFVPQCGQRVGVSGAPRWKRRGKDDNRSNAEKDGDIGSRVGCFNAEQHRVQYARGSKRERQSHQGAHGSHG